MSQIPELLAPAGSLEKLQMAICYGADAVYAGGPSFGLRAGSDNLSYEQLAVGVNFAHGRKKKVFVVLNGMLHDKELEGLADFCRFLESIAVDAVICSDLGVIETVKKYSALPIHLSTQASCLNGASARLWGQMGVERIILGREVSLQEALAIKEQSGLAIELFVHGSLCMSYSGHCVISNYTAGRDSNRGGCAHSCRFQYTLTGNGQQKKSFFMSSRDLQGLMALKQYCDIGVDSIKIEGRMKGPLYGATTTKVYREALDILQQGKEGKWQQWQEELKSFSHRDYTEAFLHGRQSEGEIVSEQRETLHNRTHQTLGVVVSANSKEIIIQVKNSFSQEAKIEILPFQGPSIFISPKQIKALGGSEVQTAHPSSLVRLPPAEGVERWNVVRRKC